MCFYTSNKRKTAYITQETDSTSFVHLVMHAMRSPYWQNLPNSDFEILVGDTVKESELGRRVIHGDLPKAMITQ